MTAGIASHPIARASKLWRLNIRLQSLGRGGDMKGVANCRFTIKSWDEKPYSEGQDVPKLTRAAVTKTFTGDIVGEGMSNT